MSTADSYWLDWYRRYRSGDDLHEFMVAQRDVAVQVATSFGRQDLRILDVGCGTGWLGAALRPYGRVWATDQMEFPVKEGRRRYPDLLFVIGDFLASRCRRSSI